MYLTKENSDKLLQELSGLSTKGSFLIINFMAMHPACKPDELDQKMESFGWVKQIQSHFGEKEFNYGRYPEGKDS